MNITSSLATSTLLASLESPGFTPRKSDAPELFEFLAGTDEKVALHAERSLARLGIWAAQEAKIRLNNAQAPYRGRLCRLIGRVARDTQEPSLVSVLLNFLADFDPKTKRNAIIALGKLGALGIAEALLDSWAKETNLAHRRSLAAALGKVGDEAALAALRSCSSDDPELQRIITESILKLERTLTRRQSSAIEPHPQLSQPVRVVYHCRQGLEDILIEEIGEALQPVAQAPGQVEIQYQGPLEGLLKIRTMLRFGFPLPEINQTSSPNIAATIANALEGELAQMIFRTWTSGIIRYRLEWANAGHRRGLTWQCAQAIARRSPALVNDPRQAPWEVIIHDEDARLSLELWPRGLQDTRFSYRQRTMPASSHPTIAAALARIAHPQPNDVVWDPFVGTGTELIECALLGSIKKLYGSDFDPVAIEAARTNLQMVGLSNYQLTRADARKFIPAQPITLIVTNPPMGRRILHRDDLKLLYDQCLSHWVKCLSPMGRIVWISPLPRLTRQMARKLRLKNIYQRQVDMGGFSAEIQGFLMSK